MLVLTMHLHAGMPSDIFGQDGFRGIEVPPVRPSRRTFADHDVPSKRDHMRAGGCSCTPDAEDRASAAAWGRRPHSAPSHHPFLGAWA
jgi:hypothetical protein